MIEDKNSFIIGYTIGNQLKLEYESIWQKQTDNILEIYQVYNSNQITPSVEVH
jgi:hypothetical protein